MARIRLLLGAAGLTAIAWGAVCGLPTGRADGRGDGSGAVDDPLAAALRRTEVVAREASRLRGLPLRRPIRNIVVDRDELRAQLVAAATAPKAAAETAAHGLALERWGLIPAGTDYPALMLALRTEQVAGFYDPDRKALTLARAPDARPMWAELLLAHELAHGLQDQAFGLRKLQDVPASEGDAMMARRALIEGDAVAVMVEVMIARGTAKLDWANPELAAAVDKSLSVPGNEGDALDRAPLAVREAMAFPYRAGLAFVAALRRRQPWSAVDAAFARPPRSTEQILHPERYLVDDRPIAVEARAPAALPGFGIAHQTVWGELGFSLWLRSHGVDERSAQIAAAGWGGDRAIVLARPGEARAARAVGAARLQWDSEADAIEAAEAAGKALADGAIGATIEETATRSRLLGVDGTVSWIDRRGSALVIVVGAPTWAAEAFAAEVWSVVAPAPARKPRR